MDIKIQPMGDYQTNCYIVTLEDKDFIIDPGVGAAKWVKQNVKNPVAILNTHGHFDHVWSNQELKEELNIPLYIHEKDAFLLTQDIFGRGTPPSTPDYLVKNDESIEIDGIEIKYHFFPGHTPGCCAIEINNTLFSGDFIFYGSIGRCDFPYSVPKDMINSINKILLWDRDIQIYPGHGLNTSLERERTNLKKWLNYL